MQVKICGITQVEQALAIAELGATSLGFICVPQSPRYVTPAALTPITQALAASDRPVTTVGVFANADLSQMVARVQQSQLQAVQLHGTEPIDQCQQLRQRLPHTKLIKAIRVRQADDLTLAHTYASHVDALLLDAYHPDQLGGTGLTLDWQALQTFAPSCPWWLAGGLTPANVAQALSTLSPQGPQGIDLSSGVEVQPGLKDMALVRQLFRQLAPWLSALPQQPWAPALPQDRAS